MFHWLPDCIPIYDSQHNGLIHYALILAEFNTPKASFFSIMFVKFLQLTQHNKQNFTFKVVRTIAQASSIHGEWDMAATYTVLNTEGLADTRSKTFTVKVVRVED